MRAAPYDEAAHARQPHITQAFRDLWQTRMLWATGTLAIIGIVAGFIFFGSAAKLPVQQQPSQPSELTAATELTQPPTPTLATLEETKLPADEEPSDSTVAAAATADCPTPINREDNWRHRRNARQLLGSLLRKAPVETACQAV